MSSTVRGLLNPNFHYCIWKLHVDVPYPPPPIDAAASSTPLFATYSSQHGKTKQHQQIGSKQPATKRATLARGARMCARARARAVCGGGGR
mmetsp:Transcript_11149/g.46416  ORF Transcript_11149/g.46416 Transcript_11149/m.46416 type:complete len:91 (+) Transcript_11149:1945-2217(+)